MRPHMRDICTCGWTCGHASHTRDVAVTPEVVQEGGRDAVGAEEEDRVGTTGIQAGGA